MENHIKEMLPLLNEKQRRLFLASCANVLERAGVRRVCEISGVTAHTVIKGKKSLKTLQRYQTTEYEEMAAGVKR